MPEETHDSPDESIGLLLSRALELASSKTSAMLTGLKEDAGDKCNEILFRTALTVAGKTHVQWFMLLVGLLGAYLVIASVERAFREVTTSDVRFRQRHGSRRSDIHSD